MLRATVLAAAAAATLMTTAASAQVIDLGRGGPSLDLRNDRQRERDYRREDERRDSDRGGYDRRDLATGSTGCRSVTVRETDGYGNTTTRRRNDC